MNEEDLRAAFEAKQLILGESREELTRTPSGYEREEINADWVWFKEGVRYATERR
ncbi:hypothetical protein [Methylocaldum sp.]|uniref:hypothetical protein n=1 Tax=Methylocaldum sp. TaxID=1969727 RepID=UPI002D3D6569|nr:hypothetical protein [Methylocaldum sp.]HYE38128.1 hypothetical protein [Methylocaldum sp.]